MADQQDDRRKLPSGYKMVKRELRGYDSPDRWWELAGPSGEKVGDFGSRGEALLASWTHHDQAKPATPAGAPIWQLAERFAAEIAEWPEWKRRAAEQAFVTPGLHVTDTGAGAPTDVFAVMSSCHLCSNCGHSADDTDCGLRMDDPPRAPAAPPMVPDAESVRAGQRYWWYGNMAVHVSHGPGPSGLELGYAPHMRPVGPVLPDDEWAGPCYTTAQLDAARAEVWDEAVRCYLELTQDEATERQKAIGAARAEARAAALREAADDMEHAAWSLEIGPSHDPRRVAAKHMHEQAARLREKAEAT